MNFKSSGSLIVISIVLVLISVLIFAKYNSNNRIISVNQHKDICIKDVTISEPEPLDYTVTGKTSLN